MVQSYFPIGATNIKIMAVLYLVTLASCELTSSYFLCLLPQIFPTLLQDVPKYLNLHN